MTTWPAPQAEAWMREHPGRWLETDRGSLRRFRNGKWEVLPVGGRVIEETWAPTRSWTTSTGPGGNMRAELERLVSTAIDNLDTLMGDTDLPDEDDDDPGCLAMRALCEVQAILTASDWIPVSERLPGEDLMCWVWFRDRDGHESAQVCYRIGDSFDTLSEPSSAPRMYKWTALAWQPIEEPAPYRAEGGG